MSQIALQPGPGDGRLGSTSLARCCRPISTSVFPNAQTCRQSPSRRGRSCRAGRRGISAFLLTDPTSDPTRPRWRRRRRRSTRQGVRTRRREVVDDQRRGRRTAGRHGPGAQTTDTGRDQRIRRSGPLPGITVERRNAFMGLRGIENGVTLHPGGCRPKTDRTRGRGTQDRPHHPQHRTALAARDVRAGAAASGV